MRFGRKSLAAVSVLAIGAAVGAAVAVPVRKAPAAPASAAQPNALSVLNARSPGQRANGAQASKGQPRMAMLSDADGPPAGLLTQTSAAAPVAAAVAAAPVPAASAVLPVAAAAVPAAGLIGIPATALAPALPAAAVVAGAGVPIAAIAGGVGAVALVPAVLGGGNNSTSIAPAAAAAVPEPGTWLMMMLGFGVLGASLRMRRRRAASLGVVYAGGRSLVRAS